MPSENCYGTDLRAEFINLGYDLFLDRRTIKSTFIPANIFDKDSALSQLTGQMSIVYAGAFFHLFGWDDQFEIAKRVVRLLKPQPGAMLIGRQLGNVKPGYFAESGYPGEKGRFRHNDRSWAELWFKVGEATDSKWKVDAMIEVFDFGVNEMEKKLTEQRKEGEARRLRFVVRRL